MKWNDFITFHIAQLGRQLKTGLGEHKAAVNKHRSNRSNVAKHILPANHSFDKTSSIQLSI